MATLDRIEVANELSGVLAHAGLDVVVYVFEAGARKPAARENQREAVYRLASRRIYAVEADAQEADRLRAVLASDPSITVMEHGVGRADGTATLHITRHPKCSSLYAPIAEMAQRYIGLHVMMPDREVEVPVRSIATLAEVYGVARIDFMKLDIQGAELDVLQGGERLLEGTLGVVCEVNFAKLYHGQPRFHDVARYMESQGFEFYKFVHQGGKARTDTRRDQQQILWADALFLRPPEALESAAAARLAIVATAYGAFDLAEVAVERSGADEVAQWYRARLRQTPSNSILAVVRRALAPIKRRAAKLFA